MLGWKEKKENFAKGMTRRKTERQREKESDSKEKSQEIKKREKGLSNSWNPVDGDRKEQRK